QATESAAQAGFDAWLAEGAYRAARPHKFDDSATLSGDFAQSDRFAASRSVVVEQDRQGRSAAWVGQEGAVELADVPTLGAEAPFTLSLSFYLPEDKYGGPLMSRIDRDNEKRGWTLSLDNLHPVFVITGDRNGRLGLKAEETAVVDRGQWNHI